MNDGFAQLAMMQPQGGAMPPPPPPQAGPVGGRLAQLWEAFKTDPNMRQAVLAASTAMMQSPPAGQNSLGMIGAGIQQGMQTFDSLKQRDRAQGLDEQRYAEQTDLKRQGVELQKRGLEQQADERRRDRRFQSLRDMSIAELQKELARIKNQGEGKQTTHPNVHYLQERARFEYNGDPAFWDARAAEYTEKTGRPMTGQDLALAEQSRIQEQKDLFTRVNSQFGVQEDIKQRGRVLETLLSQPWAAQMFEEEFGVPFETFRQQSLGAPTTPGISQGIPQPRPPVYSQRLEEGATPAMGEKGASLDERVAKGEARIYPETGETLFLRGSQKTGFWVENREGKRFELPPDFDKYPPLGR
jgi:hypothetical protein